MRKAIIFYFDLLFQTLILIISFIPPIVIVDVVLDPITRVALSVKFVTATIALPLIVTCALWVLELRTF